MLKNKPLTLNQKSLILDKKYSKNNSFAITLSTIKKKSLLSPDHRFNDLLNLLQDPYLLIQAMSNVSLKSGALTLRPKQDLSTVNGISLEIVYNISESIKTKTFRFHPIKRI